MSAKVLLVDDNPRLLRGLVRVLLSISEETEVQTANSGEEALKLLEEQQVDIVISDMRMPGMDGAELLKIVREKYPRIIRIIMSGQSNQEYSIKTIDIAHQYLAKPCDSDVLKQIIDNFVNNEGGFGNPRLLEAISSLKQLPSEPEAFSLINQELSREEPSIKKVGRIISNEPSMTAQILKIVNSAYFGIASHVTSAEQAVSMLGLEIIKSLVLTIHIFSLQETKQKIISMHEFVKHSVHVAHNAHYIVELLRCDDLLDDITTAAMLHDVGKLLLASNFPDQYRKIMENHQDSEDLYQQEIRSFGAGHAEIGAYLMQLWGLPSTVVVAIREHQKPKTNKADYAPIVAIVHLANCYPDFKTLRDRDKPMKPVDFDYLESFEFGRQLLSIIQNKPRG